MPVSTEKTITVSNLTQDELDFRDWLLNYLQHYHTPRWYEVTDFIILD